MRPEFFDDQISSSSAVALTTSKTGLAQFSGATSSSAAGAPTRDLYDLLAVIIGVCESLAENLKQSPQHSELARVGVLAADRAAELVAGLKIEGAAAPGGRGPLSSAHTDDIAAPARDSERARKVLLVEDDPDLLLLLTAAFVREGYQTYCAKNGRIGVELLQALQPDLIVTDIVMPEMEGIGTILEARRSSPHTKVIAISGGGHYGRSQNFLVWAHELGADEVLAKPFRMSSLITAARVVLDRPPPPVAEPDDAEIPEQDRLAARR